MLAVVAVTATMLALASGITLVLVRRDEMQDLDRALLAQAHLAAQFVDFRDPHHPVPEQGTAEVPEHYQPAIQYVAVYAPTGEMLSASDSFGAARPSLPDLGLRARPPQNPTAVNLAIRGKHLRGALIPMHDGFSLLYAASRAEVDADVVFLARVLFVLLILAIASTTLIAQWIGRRLASDVQEIARVARDVSAGNLAARVGASVQGSFEARALAGDLDHMIAKLEALVLAQRRFISHAAHELMSPLTTLRGELQLALRRPRSVAEHEKTLALALNDVESLVTLAEDLLTLARAETTIAGPNTARVSEILATAMRSAEGAARLRGVEFACDAAPRLGELRVCGVGRELSRALRNLVDNAASHSQAGDSVGISVDATDGRVEIAVQDSGPGVPEAFGAEIFEPFFRGARERGESDQGVGLGLSIAREIARRFGGDVVLDATYKDGARFVLRLERCAETPGVS
jgi:two-component system heavy metal sensor histidine kinase CusS